jgi:hypothetical protein
MKLKKLVPNTKVSFESFFNKKNYFIVFIYFILLFILDYSGIMNLYDQNFIRRWINMLRRRDYFTFKDKLKPFCVHNPKFLDETDIQLLQSIKKPDKLDIYALSRTNTTTHQCCDKFSEKEKNIMKNITEKCRKKYEKIIGKKLYTWNKNNTTFYIYHGKDSKHLWHVDPRNVNHIYNLIVLVDRKGEISPFQYKDKNGQIHTIKTNKGDGILFNGGTTVHQIPPNNDEKSVRTVLSIAFTSNEEDSISYKNDNLCNFLEGGNNYFNFSILVVSLFLINFIVSYLSGAKNIDNTFLITLTIISILIAKYIPLYFNTGIGSGRSSSILYNLLILFTFILITLSPKGGALFTVYFLLSDVFFPRSWVSYE